MVRHVGAVPHEVRLGRSVLLEFELFRLFFGWFVKLLSVIILQNCRPSDLTVTEVGPSRLLLGLVWHSDMIFTPFKSYFPLFILLLIIT